MSLVSARIPIALKKTWIKPILEYFDSNSGLKCDAPKTWWRCFTTATSSQSHKYFYPTIINSLPVLTTRKHFSLNHVWQDAVTHSFSAGGIVKYMKIMTQLNLFIFLSRFILQVKTRIIFRYGVSVSRQQYFGIQRRIGWKLVSDSANYLATAFVRVFLLDCNRL